MTPGLEPEGRHGERFRAPATRLGDGSQARGLPLAAPGAPQLGHLRRTCLDAGARRQKQPGHRRHRLRQVHPGGRGDDVAGAATPRRLQQGRRRRSPGADVAFLCAGTLQVGTQRRRQRRPSRLAPRPQQLLGHPRRVQERRLPAIRDAGPGVLDRRRAEPAGSVLRRRHPRSVDHRRVCALRHGRRAVAQAVAQPGRGDMERLSTLRRLVPPPLRHRKRAGARAVPSDGVHEVRGKSHGVRARTHAGALRRGAADQGPDGALRRFEPRPRGGAEGQAPDRDAGAAGRRLRAPCRDERGGRDVARLPGCPGSVFRGAEARPVEPARREARRRAGSAGCAGRTRRGTPGSRAARGGGRQARPRGERRRPSRTPGDGYPAPREGARETGGQGPALRRSGRSARRDPRRGRCRVPGAETALRRPGRRAAVGRRPVAKRIGGATCRLQPGQAGTRRTHGGDPEPQGAAQQHPGEAGRHANHAVPSVAGRRSGHAVRRRASGGAGRRARLGGRRGTAAQKLRAVAAGAGRTLCAGGAMGGQDRPQGAARLLPGARIPPAGAAVPASGLPGTEAVDQAGFGVPRLAGSGARASLRRGLLRHRRAVPARAARRHPSRADQDARRKT